MAETLATSLEAGNGSLNRTCREDCVAREIFEDMEFLQHLDHMLRVRLPIRCQPQFAAGFECAKQQFDKSRLDQSPFVMTLLGPWVRKEDVNSREALRRQAGLENFYSVMTDHAYVAQLLCVDPEQQMAYAGTMDFHTQAINVGMLPCIGRKRIACTEAYLK